MTMRSISLPDESWEFAEAQARREGFDSVDDYVDAVLHTIRLGEAKRKLEAKILEAIDSGPSEPMTAESWDELRREVSEQLEAERRVG